MEKLETYASLLNLIKLAQGDRSLNQFALNCNINVGHLSRVLNGKFVNPPKPDFLKRIAEHADNDVTYESLMEAAGYVQGTSDEMLKTPEDYGYKYKIKAKDMKQLLASMQEATKAFFMDDEFDEEDKKEYLDTINEMFWISKAMNKRKPKGK